MADRQDLRLTLYVVSCAVPAGAGLVVAIALVGRSGGLHAWLRTGFLLVVAVSLAYFSRKMRSFEGSVTLTSVVVLAAYPIAGPWGAVVVSAAPLLDIANHFSLLQRLFNTAVVVLPSVAGVASYTLLSGPPGKLLAPVPIAQTATVVHAFRDALIACIVTDLVRFVVNALLFAPLTVLLSGRSLRDVLRSMARDLWRSALPSHLGFGPLGVLMAVVWFAGLNALAAVLVLVPLVIAHTTLARSVQEEDAREETLRTLIRAVETKDPYTRGHSERVASGVDLLGSAVGLTGARLRMLRFAGLLHDVGKLGVPTRVLTKNGGLTDDEYAEIRSHPLQGFDIVTGIDFLDEARTAILHHHERLDGGGYPAGLAGDAIPEASRMISVVDAFDSMTSARSYHRPRSVEDALAELRRCGGTHFDPRFVEAFCRTVDRIGWRITDGLEGLAVSVGASAPTAAGPLAAATPGTAAGQSTAGRSTVGETPVGPYDHDDPTSTPTIIPAGPGRPSPP